MPEARVLRITACLVNGRLEMEFEHAEATAAIPWELHYQALRLIRKRMDEVIAQGPKTCPKRRLAGKPDTGPRCGVGSSLQLSSSESEEAHGPQG